MNFKKISKKLIKVALSGVLLIFIFFSACGFAYSTSEFATPCSNAMREFDKNTELLKAKTSNLDNINTETEQVKKDIEELTGQIDNLKKEETEASIQNQNK